MSTDASTVPDPAKRRTLKRIAAGAGGAATVAVGSTQVPRYSPIGRANAIAFTTLIGFTAGATAGILISEYILDGGDFDPEQPIADQSYYASRAVAEGRESFIDEMEAEILGPSNVQTIPFADAAWQSIEAEAARVTTNGGSETEAQQAADEQLNRQFAMAVTNVIERWNTGINGVVDALYHDHDKGIDQFTLGNAHESEALYPWDPKWDDPDIDASGVNDDTYGSVSPVETPTFDGEMSITTTGETQEWGDGDHWLYELDVDEYLPYDTSSLENRDESLKCLTLPSENAGAQEVGGYHNNVCWYNPLSGTKTESLEVQMYEDTNSVLGVPKTVNPLRTLTYEHSDLGTVELLDASLFYDILSRIEDAYEAISSDLSTYISQIHQGVTEGMIDPSDLITAEGLYAEFSDSSAMSRLAAQLMAAGAQVPADSWGYTVTVSHPGIESDQLTGQLFPQFVDSISDPSIQSGTTLSADDYRIAYFAYQGPNSDQPETLTLSGDSDLEIVQIYNEEGEEVDSIEYSQPVEYVSDPTTVDTTALQERIEYQNEQLEKLREALDDDSSGPVFPWDDGGLLDWLMGIKLFGVPLWIPGAGLLGLGAYNRVKGD